MVGGIKLVFITQAVFWFPAEVISRMELMQHLWSYNSWESIFGGPLTNLLWTVIFFLYSLKNQNLKKKNLKQKSVRIHCRVVIKVRLPRWFSGKESSCQGSRCRRYGIDPWVGKIPWRRRLQPTLVFLPQKSHGQRWVTVHLTEVGYSGVPKSHACMHAQW